MEEVLAELKKLNDALASFVAESKTAATAEVEAEAIADAKKDAAKEAVSSYKEQVKAIDAIDDLLPEQREELLDAAERGEDIAPLIESAKKVAEGFKKHFTESAGYVLSGGHVVLGESADDFEVRNWA